MKRQLLLNEQESSYLDGIQTEDGTLFVIDDHQRNTCNHAGKQGSGLGIDFRVWRRRSSHWQISHEQVRLHQVVIQLQETVDTPGAPGDKDPTRTAVAALWS